MDSNEGTTETMAGSWLAALAVGTLAGCLLWLLGGWGFLQACFIGGLVFVVVGALLSWTMGRSLPAPNEAVLETPTITPATPSAAARTTKASPVKAAPIKVAPAPTVAKVKPSKKLEGEAELAARKGTWKYEGNAAEKPAPKKKAAAKPAAAAEAPADRPTMMLDAPEGGQADDLKKISGVGPKLETTLNELGIWHYEQVASFKKKDIAWVDERLRFKGRIERDDWVGQAKELAKAKG